MEVKDIVDRLRDVYWMADMSRRAMGADICAEAAEEIEILRSKTMSARKITILFLITWVCLGAVAIRLEQRSNASFVCSHSVAVVTPQGFATDVCAP